MFQYHSSLTKLYEHTLILEKATSTLKKGIRIAFQNVNMKSVSLPPRGFPPPQTLSISIVFPKTVVDSSTDCIDGDN